jgi:branched-chain amino acid aminotransferase
MKDNNSLLNFNGQLLTPGDDALVFLNRALRLGDGFFETIRVIEGVPHAWPGHSARIFACCKSLSIVPQPHMDAAFLQKCISDLLVARKTESARLRITFFRQGEGAYRPQNNRLGFIAEATPLSEGGFQVKDEGMLLGLYNGMPKYRSNLAAYKLLGNHVYIQAAAWAETHHYDDVLICNEAGEIIEASSSNVFVVRNGALITPPITSGCVGGVMRMSVINAALEAGINCYESTLDEKDFLNASEVFLTNAVRGISWVRSYRDKRFFHKVSDHLVSLINRRHQLVLSAWHASNSA